METTTSADGTAIAYDRAGDGPALVVAMGAFCDHGIPPEELAPVLTEFFLASSLRLAR